MNQWPDEVWYRLFCLCDSGSLYKSLLFLCKRVRRIGYIKVIYKKAKATLANHLWTLIKMYPHANWDWYAITQNPNTINFNDSRLSAAAICMNPNVTMEQINMYYTFNWNFQIFYNKNIPLQFVLNNTDLNWNWTTVSESPNVTMEIIKTYPNLPWNINVNPNITMDIIAANPDYRWIWHRLANHKNMTLEIIKSHSEKPWYRYNISRNPNLTWEFIQTNSNWEWNKNNISTHKNMTWDIIKKNWDWFKDAKMLTTNPNLTWKNIKALEVIDTSIILNPYVSSNPNLTWEIIANHPLLFFREISMNTFGK